MNILRTILSTCINFYNVRLTFEPYSFTVLQAILGGVFLGLAIIFIRKVFTD